ncbi:MAG TPA: hypothetical protein PLV92_08065 [Pirellulaceae bacterium]|nr:hypothetical protein [Pirellulaceae bacterium]
MSEQRKTLQLCRQVAETLSYVLSGECHDEQLAGLQVLAVEPAPNASQLLVTVAPGVGETLSNPVETMARLHDAAGWLRTEVAAAITRRRAPQLLFRIQASAADDRPPT